MWLESKTEQGHFSTQEDLRCTFRAECAAHADVFSATIAKPYRIFPNIVTG
jgi:hypothetical protein